MCCAFLCVGKQHQARIRRLLRLCALRAPLCPGHTARSLRNASIPTSLLTSPVVPTNKKAHQDDVLFLLYGTIYGREPENLFSAFGGCLQTLASCTVFKFADTYCLSLIDTMPSTPCCPRVVCFAFEIALLK